MAKSPEPTQGKETTPGKNRPVHELRIGANKATIWNNQTANGPMFNVTFARVYKDAEDNWKESQSFSRDDLLVLAKLADHAHDWICAQASPS